MVASSAPHDLTGQMLIAMPGMGDPRFAGGVVYLCAHGAEGAMGLIINKQMQDVSFADMLEQLDVEVSGPMPAMPICFGGPVEMRRGFVLHSAEYGADREDRLSVDESFAMTTTIDVIVDIAAGRGPELALMALGYAGWDAGQLEDEIQRNGWLTCAATQDLVFGTPMDEKWAAALASLGVNPLNLSSEAGRA